MMRFREWRAGLPGLDRAFGTERHGASGSTPVLRARTAAPHFASPTAQLALEIPALSARRLVRLQTAAIGVISFVVALCATLGIALSGEDRSLPLATVGVLLALGGMLVSLTAVAHARSVSTLMQTASYLRQSAAERAAELARTNAELRRQEAERVSLFAAMSHELRTPLSSIAGFSRALLDGLDGDLNEEQRASVRRVHQSANGLLGIVGRTLDFARLEAGEVTMQRGPVRVWPVVEEAALALHPLAAARGLDVDRLIPPAVPPVEADEGGLRQVLVNLIANAMKFSDAGPITVRAEEAGEQVTIAVSDTGPGIARDDHERIFEPFRPLSSGAVHANGRTGLGLAICRRLVEMMDGRIWVESEPGAGATFFVSLPAVRLSPVEATVDDLRGPACDVMLVADTARARPLAASLRGRGLEARLVSGPTAIDEVGLAAPRLVLVDLFLHHAEAWRQLVALRSTLAHRDRAIGLVGLADGGGRLIVPAELDVVVDADLDVALAGRVQALCPELTYELSRTKSRVLVVGGDVAWRRRVSLILEARGIRAVEASGAEDALLVARRMPVRCIVADLLLPDPGISDLLGRLQADQATRRVPVLLVGPGALTPGQQRDLRRESARWSAEQAVPVSELAAQVARTVHGFAPGDLDAVTMGEGTWRAH